MFLEAEKAGWQHGLRQEQLKGRAGKVKCMQRGKFSFHQGGLQKSHAGLDTDHAGNQKAPGPKGSSLWELLVKEDLRRWKERRVVKDGSRKEGTDTNKICPTWALGGEGTSSIGRQGAVTILSPETHSSIPAWRIPRTEEPVGLQSMAKSQTRMKLLSMQ